MIIRARFLFLEFMYMRNLPFSCPSANPLAKDDKEDAHCTDREHDTSKNHSKNQETIGKNPGENLISHTE